MFGADTLVAVVVSVALIALGCLALTHALGQPPFIAYMATGIIAGPSFLGLIHDHAVVQALGEFGLILLLFFVGMEIDLGFLVRTWRKVVVSTFLQIGLTVIALGLVGYLLGWECARIVLLGFVVSLSSTAIVLKYLESRGLMYTKIGSYVCGVLFTQDIAVGPMLVVLALMAGSFSTSTIALQAGGILVLGSIFYLLWTHPLPSSWHLVCFLRDREHALFFNICVGIAMAGIAALFGVSVGIGAFLAGMLAAKHYAKPRILEQLESIKTVLLAAFFMSIGALVDVSFMVAHAGMVVVLASLVFSVNTAGYAVLFRLLRFPLRQSIYMAALLAQIGEFSFFVALAGYDLGVISAYAYQLTVLVIALTLVVSPLWIRFFRRLEPGAKSPQVASPLFVRTPYRWAA